MPDVRFDELANFFPKQIQATEEADTHKYTLYGGAMGGGKSRWLRWYLLRTLIRFAAETGQQGIRAGLFCEDYPALAERHLSKIPFEFPAWIGEFHKQEHEFHIHPDFGGGVIAFRNLDDPSKYQSSEYAIIGVDELTRNKKEVFDFLRLRLRWPGIPKPKFVAGTNPGGIGHGWVRKLWMDGEFDANEREAKEFVYVPSKGADNPHLDATYYDQLSSMPEEKRRAFRDGNWDVFEGQIFTEFNREMHVVNPNDRPNLAYYRKFCCFDYGFTNPGALYWCFIDFDGNVIVYRELYATGLTYNQWGKQGKRLTGNEKIEYVVTDPACWPDTDQDGQTRKSGVKMMSSEWPVVYVKGHNDRLDGLNVFRQRLQAALDPGLHLPALYFYPNCVKAIATIPELVYDRTKGTEAKPKEDVDTNGEDHAFDSIRYGLMSIRRPTTPLPASNIEAKLKALRNQARNINLIVR
jgi:hypothetical protein